MIKLSLTASGVLLSSSSSSSSSFLPLPQQLNWTPDDTLRNSRAKINMLRQVMLAVAAVVAVLPTETAARCQIPPDANGVVVIDSTITEIEYGWFEGCTSLRTLDFSGATGLETVEYSSFEDCTSLTSVDFSGATSLRTIGSSSFEGCTSLASVQVLPGVDVASDAFIFFGCDDGFICDVAAQGINFENCAPIPECYANELSRSEDERQILFAYIAGSLLAAIVVCAYSCAQWGVGHALLLECLCECCGCCCCCYTVVCDDMDAEYLQDGTGTKLGFKDCMDLKYHEFVWGGVFLRVGDMMTDVAFNVINLGTIGSNGDGAVDKDGNRYSASLFYNEYEVTQKRGSADDVRIASAICLSIGCLLTLSDVCGAFRRGHDDVGRPIYCGLPRIGIVTLVIALFEVSSDIAYGAPPSIKHTLN